MGVDVDTEWRIGLVGVVAVLLRRCAAEVHLIGRLDIGTLAEVADLCTAGATGFPQTRLRGRAGRISVRATLERTPRDGVISRGMECACAASSGCVR